MTRTTLIIIIAGVLSTLSAAVIAYSEGLVSGRTINTQQAASKLKVLSDSLDLAYTCAPQCKPSPEPRGDE